VEEKVVNQGGKMTTVAVPVEMPDGVSHEGVFGDEMMTKEAEAYNSPRKTSLRSSGAGASAPASIAAPPPSKPVAGVKVKRQGYVSPREYEPDYSSSPITPEQKMDKSLKDIAGRVKKEGRNGNLDMKNFKVKNGRVELILTVTHVSGKMLHQLRGMGFSVKTFSKTQKIITGSIAVDKVQSLSKLNFVTKIEPNPGPAAANGLNPKEVTAGLHRLTGQMFAGLLKLITV
jgi:Ca-activated chloride channel family protein